MQLVIRNLDTNKVYSIVTYHTSKGGGETTIVATGLNSVTNVINTTNSGTEFVVNDNVCFLSGLIPGGDAAIQVTSTNGWKGVSGFQLLESVAKPKLTVGSQDGNVTIEWFSGLDAQLHVQQSNDLLIWGQSQYDHEVVGDKTRIVIPVIGQSVTREYFMIQMTP